MLGVMIWYVMCPRVPYSEVWHSSPARSDCSQHVIALAEFRHLAVGILILAPLFAQIKTLFSVRKSTSLSYDVNSYIYTELVLNDSLYVLDIPLYFEQDSIMLARTVWCSVLKINNCNQLRAETCELDFSVSAGGWNKAEVSVSISTAQDIKFIVRNQRIQFADIKWVIIPLFVVFL